MWSRIDDCVFFVTTIGTNTIESNVYCNDSNICKIECLSNDACSNLRLYCIGQCFVDCDEDAGISCPLSVSGNYSIWTITEPTSEPSFEPSIHPTETTNHPSLIPSSIPSNIPSSEPSIIPSGGPSIIPSRSPSMNPSSQPSHIPSIEPSIIPSDAPSIIPSIDPPIDPSSQPSNNPTTFPTNYTFISSSTGASSTINTIENSTQLESTTTETTDDGSNVDTPATSGSNGIGDTAVIVIVIIICVSLVITAIVCCLACKEYFNKRIEMQKQQIELAKIREQSRANDDNLLPKRHSNYHKNKHKKLSMLSISNTGTPGLSAENPITTAVPAEDIDGLDVDVDELFDTTNQITYTIKDMTLTGGSNNEKTGIGENVDNVDTDKNLNTEIEGNVKELKFGDDEADDIDDGGDGNVNVDVGSDV